FQAFGRRKPGRPPDTRRRADCADANDSCSHDSSSDAQRDGMTETGGISSIDGVAGDVEVAVSLLYPDRIDAIGLSPARDRWVVVALAELDRVGPGVVVARGVLPRVVDRAR